MTIPRPVAEVAQQNPYSLADGLQPLHAPPEDIGLLLRALSPPRPLPVYGPSRTATRAD